MYVGVVSTFVFYIVVLVEDRGDCVCFE